MSVSRMRMPALLLAAALALHAGSTRAAEMEVLHYWTSPAESAAVAVLREAYEARGGFWFDRPVADNKTARQTMIDRGVDGIPPAVMHWIGSITDIQQLADLGIVRPLGDPGLVSGETVPEMIRTRIGRDGVFYLAPLAVHSENWLWYNAKVLSDAGLAPPKSWEELIAVAAALSARGVTPIVSNVEGWEIQVVVRTLMTEAYLDADYRTLTEADWRAGLRHPAFLRLVGRLAALKPYIRPPRHPGGWSAGTEDVMDGAAAMQFMGDWVKGEFVRRGLEPGVDIGCVWLPGPDRMVLVGVDGFMFSPRTDPDETAAQDLFAEVVMDPEVQIAFSAVKGSLPARSDVAPERLDPCAREVQRAFAEKRVAPRGPRLASHDSAAGPKLLGLLTDFLADPAVDEAELGRRLDALAADRSID